MSMPSPFEIGRAVGGNISGAFSQQRDVSAIDEILQQANDSQDPGVIDDVMRQVISRVSPERQGVALQILQNKQKNILENKKLMAKQQEKAVSSSLNPEAQKWAYKELEKKAPIQALNNSLQELRRLNKSGVTGPIGGRTPSFLADKEADALRKAIDANAIQILNVHKSMFPRGLTQGEFNTLGKKLVSSTNTQEANDAILNAYEKLADLQQKKLDAVQDATQKYGFDPMLPFIVSGIQKQFDDEEELENKNLYKMVVGETPKPESKKSEKKQSEKKSEKKMSLMEIFQ